MSFQISWCRMWRYLLILINDLWLCYSSEIRNIFFLNSATSGYAHGLLLALCSWIASGMTLGTLWGEGIKLKSTTCNKNSLAAVNHKMMERTCTSNHSPEKKEQQYWNLIRKINFSFPDRCAELKYASHKILRMPRCIQTPYLRLNQHLFLESTLET